MNGGCSTEFLYKCSASKNSSNSIASNRNGISSASYSLSNRNIIVCVTWLYWLFLSTKVYNNKYPPFIILYDV